MREPAHVIGEKPVTYDAYGWLQLHPAYEGWVPAEPATLSGRLRTIVWCAILAGLVTLIERAFQ